MLSNEDNALEEKDMFLFRDWQCKFTDSYFALLLRILKKFPNCTYSIAEHKIFEGLGISDIITDVTYAPSFKHQMWNDICASPPICATKTNSISKKIEEIRRTKGLRYRDAIRAIRLQMLFDHICAQSSEMTSQVKLMQTLTEKLNHLYEMTPPPQTSQINPISCQEMNDMAMKEAESQNNINVDLLVKSDERKEDIMQPLVTVNKEVMICEVPVSVKSVVMSNVDHNNLNEKNSTQINNGMKAPIINKEKEEISSYSSDDSYVANNTNRMVGSGDISTKAIKVKNDNKIVTKRLKSGHNKKTFSKNHRSLTRLNSGNHNSASKDRELDRNLKRKRQYMEEMEESYELEYCDNKTKDGSENKNIEQSERSGRYNVPPNKKYRRIVGI